MGYCTYPIQFFFYYFTAKCSISLFEHTESPGELVWATGRFHSTPYAFQFVNDIIHLHSPHERGDALKVAIAAPNELHHHNAVIVINLYVDEFAACALCSIGNCSVGHYSAGFMFV